MPRIPEVVTGPIAETLRYRGAESTDSAILYRKGSTPDDFEALASAMQWCWEAAQSQKWGCMRPWTQHPKS